jgi:uncharacterized 2Fe-2S/4Fe-4S cluster protein (DUF4445 family)
LTVKKRVKLLAPTLADNLADLERLSRALGTERRLDVPLPLLRSLPFLLRSTSWDAGVVLVNEDVGNALVSIGDRDARNLGAALDIGTTTVVLSLVDLESGETLATASDYNRQMRAGDDVISRIAYAEEGGLEELQGLVIQSVNHLLREAKQACPERAGTGVITALSVAGNTTMVHLFLGIDPMHIRYEPYVPVANVPPLLKGKDLQLDMEPEGPVFILPGRASFVGGDITADVVASGLRRGPELTLLIDVGTNGEVVVGNDELLVACSTSAGPAFEGGEVASGMRAMSGAVERVRIGADLEPELGVIGGGRPIGICGSGLIDLVAQMFLRGLLDKKGRIQDLDSKRVRRTDEGMEYVLFEDEVQGPSGKRIVISDADLANILRTKAAVHAGCCVLLKALGKGHDDLGRVCIAGGFGNYIDVENAVAIGLLPDLPRQKFDFIGNASLAGAEQVLLSREKRREAFEVHHNMTYLELSTSQDFFDEFSSATFLPHTDAERFPSIMRRQG